MESQGLAHRMRKRCIEMIYRAQTSHAGSCLSVVDLLAVLFANHLGDSNHLVFSKGHAAAALYSGLAERGLITNEELSHYGQDGSRLCQHVSHHVPGVRFSTGSLGHGLPLALGLAQAARLNNQTHRIYCVISDGELNEGSCWESFMVAAHLKLINLTVVVDANGLQGTGKTTEVLNLNPLKAKFEAFGWAASEIDGHDHRQIHQALIHGDSTRPQILIAKTHKGHGVSFMQNQLHWHYRTLTEENYELAMKELG